jgi:tetratricopeptide (TPR) repeat protein
MNLILLKNNVVLLILIVLFPFYISGQNKDISKAIDAYNNKDFQKAIVIYTELLSGNNFSPDLYYNLGDSYYKNGEFGKALLYFEKALKYEPNNKYFQHNIYVVKRKIDSEIIELSDFFLKRWWDSLTNLFSLEIWTILSVLFAILIVVLLFLLWFHKERFRFVSYGVVLLFITFFMISIFASNNVKNRIYNNKNVVLINIDSLYSAPDIRSDLLYKLDAGEKLNIIDSIDTWYRVKLLNKELGWINKKNCEKI